MRLTLLALAVGVGCGGPPAPVAAPEQLQVNGPQLWVQVAGNGDPTVAF